MGTLEKASCKEGPLTLYAVIGMGPNVYTYDILLCLLQQLGGPQEMSGVQKRKKNIKLFLGWTDLLDVGC